MVLRLANGDATPSELRLRERMNVPRVARAQPWAGISERFQRYGKTPPAKLPHSLIPQKSKKQFFSAKNSKTSNPAFCDHHVDESARVVDAIAERRTQNRQARQCA